MQFGHLKRREFMTLLGSAAAGWPLTARGQHSERPYRVAYLALLAGLDSAVVQQQLQELGYTEGNLIFDYRSAEGHSERLPELAAELVRTKPDVLIAGFGTLTAKAAQAATASIPIVFVSVGDPIGAGIVNSLNRVQMLPGSVPRLLKSAANACRSWRSLSRAFGW
jgi:putative tryptophan/tyrosine transport system substrate-binding protein